MALLLLLLLPLAAIVCVYFFFFLRRSFLTLGASASSTRTKIVTLSLSVLIGACCLFYQSTAFVFVMYLFVFSLALTLLNLLVRSILRARGGALLKGWEHFYASGFLPFALSCALVLSGLSTMLNVVPTYYTVRTEKPIRQEGYRVALIADVHFGVWATAEEIRAVCDQIEAQDIDLLVLCGDIVDESTPREQLCEIFSVFGEVQSTYGTFYAYGNHDRPRRQAQDAEEVLSHAISSAGICILQDDGVRLSPDLLLFGREDRGFAGEEARMPIKDLLSDVGRDDFCIALDHQPCEYWENGEAGTDLLLSGHTHGGQIWPLGLIQRLMGVNDAIYGYTQIDSDSAAVVTSGLAAWNYKVKNAAPAEYAVIDIFSTAE